MKETKAIDLGFSKQEIGKTFKYTLIRGDIVFGYSKCKFSGNNLGYWITKGNETKSIGNKESFEYLLSCENPWQLSCKIND